MFVEIDGSASHTVSLLPIRFHFKKKKKEFFFLKYLFIRKKRKRVDPTRNLFFVLWICFVVCYTPPRLRYLLPSRPLSPTTFNIKLSKITVWQNLWVCSRRHIILTLNCCYSFLQFSCPHLKSHKIKNIHQLRTFTRINKMWYWMDNYLRF